MFVNYCSFELMDNFKEELRPLIQDAQKNLHRYNKENAEIKEIVARFDAVLTDKVNKFTIVSLKKEFQETYLTNG